MQELRRDDLTGTCVILAPSRATRPGDAVRVEPATAPTREPAVAASPCPFCRGYETLTPPEVARTGGGDPETPGWRVRAVPNLYPVVGDGVDGAHEVVILSPSHDADFAALDDDRAVEVFTMLRDRAAHHLARGLRHAQPFINHGRAAGASLPHPHAQLVVLGFVPPRVDMLLDRFARAERDLVAEECNRARGRAYLVTDGPAVVWCPPASWSPFMARVAVPATGSRFDEASDDDVRAAAVAVRDVLSAQKRVLGDFPYNVIIETGPTGDGRPFHWWIDVVPRLTVVAGFELGTGLWVNVVSPDAAAQALRDGQ
jgi:UDPglucose--hexose-1-phosphate uridylyltransferase